MDSLIELSQQVVSTKLNSHKEGGANPFGRTLGPEWTEAQGRVTLRSEGILHPV